MSYIKQVQTAIDYIEDNLKVRLDINEIAKQIAFSHWHFQRIFYSVTGDTVKEYIRKRRLTIACNQLINSEKRIIDIAFDFQFESQESFTRAFKRLFGMNPGQYRNRRNYLPLNNKIRVTEEYLEHLYGGIKMEPKIVERGETNIIGMSANFISILSADKTNHHIIPKLWDDFNSHLNEVRNRKNKICLGLCEAIPKYARLRDDEFIYTACAEVENIDTIPFGMIAKTIQGGKYAVFTHKGKLEKLEYTMNYIYGSWLAKSEYECADIPDIELYDERFKPDSDDSEFDIYVPIKESSVKAE